MNILIAGDSFAEVGPYSWSNYLRINTGWQIKNIAKSGTSFPWTYKQLCKEKLDTYDAVIVVLTDPSRCYNPGKIQITNYNHACYNLDNKIYQNSFEENLNQAVKYFYEFIFDHELAVINYLCLANKLKTMIPNLYFIIGSGYDNMTDDIRSLSNHKFTLVDIFQYEIENLPEIKNVYQGKMFNLITQYKESFEHINHLTIPNKKLLAKYFQEFIITGHSNIILEDFHQMKNIREFEFYYREKEE